MKIEVDVEEVTKKFYLLQELGSGNYGDKSFDISTVIPSGSPHVTYQGKRYKVSMRDIIFAICAAHEEELENA